MVHFNNLKVLSKSNSTIGEVLNGKTSLNFRELMASKAFGLTAYYDAMIANWFNKKLSDKWANIRQVRKVVTGAIEVHRQTKVIGSSLEASPLVYITKQHLFDQLKSIDFSEICITSDVELHLGPVSKEMFTVEDVEDVGVKFKVAEGKKCARCWKYVDTFSDVNGCEDICYRCSDALNRQK